MKKIVSLVTAIGFILGVSVNWVGGSCQRPSPWQIKHCQELEQAILGATVRIALHGWVEVENGYEVERINGKIGHATVVDGRYLITHNHFGLPLSQVLLFNRHANGGFTGVSLYRLDGTALLDRASITAFAVVAEQGETAVLDFGAGFFTVQGVRSVTVAEGTAVTLQPGMEVAQVDWDGRGQTRVVWTEIETLYAEEGLPLMQVRHFVERGASGGGVFVAGQHIGNNWARIKETNRQTGQITQNRTLVALNTDLITPLP